MNFTVCLEEVSNFVFVVIRSFCEAETAPNNKLALILPPKSKKSKGQGSSIAAKITDFRVEFYGLLGRGLKLDFLGSTISL